MHTRIKYFRENFKDWALVSNIENLETISIKNVDHLMCTVKSEVKNPDGVVKATGLAYELLGSTMVNKTSFIENCETSANGRALGNFGIGIETSVASADEVNLAIKQHEEPKEKPKLDKVKYEAMVDAINDGKHKEVEKRMAKYKISKKQKANLDKLIDSKLAESLMKMPELTNNKLLTAVLADKE